MTNSYGKGVRLAALGLAAATVLSLAAPAFAGEKPAAGKGNGVMAAIDPASGKLRQPTAAESKALAAGVESLLKRSASTLQAKQTADGTMSVDLGTSFLNISIAQVGPDGALQQICVDNAAQGSSLLATAAPLYEDK